MDSYGETPGTREPVAGDDDIGHEPPIRVGQDERRMQVRAYNHWTGLLGARNLPRIEDLAGAGATDFADHAVVLDFSAGVDNPAVTMLGLELAAECGSAWQIERLSDVPAESLLCRITDHYRQILVNKAPIGFEAEFIDQRGKTVVYRGILLPFSGDGEHIQQVMGVINWKELADAALTARLHQELHDVAVAQPVPPAPPLGEWADGPAAGGIADDGDACLASRDLMYGLALARELAQSARDLEDRSRAALHAAMGEAWNLALAAQQMPESFSAMLAEAGLKSAPYASMTTMAKLVLGAGHDHRRRAAFATALDHARRQGTGYDGLAALLDGPGGLQAAVRKERKLRCTEKAATRDQRG